MIFTTGNQGEAVELLLARLHGAAIGQRARAVWSGEWFGVDKALCYVRSRRFPAGQRERGLG